MEPVVLAVQVSVTVWGGVGRLDRASAGCAERTAMGPRHDEGSVMGSELPRSEPGANMLADRLLVHRWLRVSGLSELSEKSKLLVR